MHNLLLSQLEKKKIKGFISHCTQIIQIYFTYEIKVITACHIKNYNKICFRIYIHAIVRVEIKKNK